MLINIMGGGSVSVPLEIPVSPVPTIETTLVDPSAVAPPPAGFVAATAATMPIGAEQNSKEHGEKRLGIGALPNGNASTSSAPSGVAPSEPAPAPSTGAPLQDGGAGPSLNVVPPPSSYVDVPINMPHISLHSSPP